MQAQAVVFEAPLQVAVRAVEVPEPGPRDVVVSTRYSWISNGTEGSFLRGERIAGDTPWSPSDPLPFPHVPGYQKTGVITWVGREVRGLSVGDWVFATVSRVNGMFYDFAGHISPAVTPADQIWRLPRGVDPVSASGLVLTQVGYNCGSRAPIQRDEVAVVMGDGMVGQWAAQTLAWRGARVIMLGHHDWRLAHLHAPNATAVNTAREDALAAAKRLALEGVAMVVDTVGDVPTVEKLLAAMRHDGHVVSAGFCGTHGLIDIQKLRNGEITLHCPSGWSKQRMDATLDLLARGALDTASLITTRLPVAQAPEAWQSIQTQRQQIMGVVLEWQA